MPIYTYRYTDAKGGQFDEFQRINDDALIEHDGRPCERGISLPNVRTRYGKGSGTEPIEMHSIALSTDDEIREFNKRNPNTKISKDPRDALYGVPIAQSRSEKLKILDREGFQEAN